MILRNLLLVFVGGGTGCIARYGISLLLKRFCDNLHGFPVHTFVANIIGCLIIGLATGYLAKHANSSLSLLLVTGFCGGFTTFSTFSLESLSLFKCGQPETACLYILTSLATCLLFVSVGLFAAYKI